MRKGDSDMEQRVLLISALLAAGLLVSPSQAEFSFKMPGKIVFEAEAGKVEEHFQVDDLADASNGKVVYLKERTNKKNPKQPGEYFFTGSIEYRFKVETEGKYMLWLRKLWMDGCGNSVWCTINKPMKEGNEQTLGEDGTYGKLTWVRFGDKPVHLKAGTNVLRIQNREDGIKLDQFAFIEFEEGEKLKDQLVPVGGEQVTCTPSSE